VRPNVSGAHDLIRHILEPSLHRRATLRDIAMHCWLQDEPQRDSTIPTDITWPERSGNNSSSDGEERPIGDDSGENLDHSLSESDQIHSCSENRQRVSPVVVAPSSFYDSLSMQECDGHCLSVSSRRSPNSVLLDDVGSNHSDHYPITASDYIPLSDDNTESQYRALSGNVSSRVYNNDGGSFSDEPFSTTCTPSDLNFQSISQNCHGTNSNQCSDAHSVTASDVTSLLANGMLATTSETAKLPVSFSADSLELLAVEDHTDSIGGNDESGSDGEVADVKNLVSAEDNDDDGEVEDDHCDNYDFADIDAVLDIVSSDVSSETANADASLRVSYDSLEDAV